MTKTVSYSKLANTLQKLGAQLSAAETHGLLAGMLTLAKPANDSAWRNTLLEHLDCETPTKTQWTILSETSDQIIHDFTNDDFNFNLLLPSDDLPLVERVNALCFWCRGYLSGLGLVGITKEDLANPTVKELIADLSHIAHVGIDADGEDTEEDEHNFMELVEFVRVAVQNIQVELTSGERSRMLH